MTKICPLCVKPIKTDDVVVFLGLARFKEKEASYDLELMAQTISSHLYCAENKHVLDTEAK